MSLMSVFGEPPVDPIVSPLLMGYQGGEGMVRELARVAQPLGGAWNVPQTQLYNTPFNARAIPTSAQRYGTSLQILPLSSRAAADGEYNALPTARSGYGSEPVYSSSQLPSQQDEMRDISNVLGFTPTIETAKDSAQSQDDEGAVPDHIRKLFLGEDRPESQLKGKYGGDGKLYAERAMAERLRGAEDREEGEWLLKEEVASDKLQSQVNSQLSLQPMEEQLEKAVEINQEKARKAREMRRDALAELANYHQELLKQEKDSANQVKFLRAAHNYAQLAQKEMEDAVAKDIASQKVIQDSDHVSLDVTL